MIPARLEIVDVHLNALKAFFWVAGAAYSSGAEMISGRSDEQG